MQEPIATWLDLYDWRRRVAEHYRERERALRAAEDPMEMAARFRAAKDALFRSHPQSPLEPDDRVSFTGLRYFPYDAALAVEAVLTSEPAASGDDALPASGPHAMRFARAARVTFSVGGQELALAVYWIDVYGGGLFLPFRDATCPAESYGGGRYLFDTVKGSDFPRLNDAPSTPVGYAGGRILLDLNYTYNPSKETQTMTPPSPQVPIPSVPGQHPACF